MSQEEIPKEVVSVEHYREYRKLAELSTITLPSRLIETSDIHVKIDPLYKQDFIDKKIAHLPFDEKHEILKKVKIARMLHNKMLDMRSKAYGMRSLSYKPHRERMEMLLDERSAEILEYYGRYLDDSEVLKILHFEWGYNISQQALFEWKKRHKKKITTLQEGFRKDLNSSRLYHKKYRLEELWFLYKDRKRNYTTTNSRDDVRLMMMLLKQAKDEAEINQLHITGEVNHKVEMNIAHHIEREIMNHLTIQDIIIARVAHRLKVNPAYIIARLHSSVYAKFTGFGEVDDSLFEDEIVYPSTMVYDWSMIKRRHSEETEETAFEEITPVEKTSLSEIKERLKERLSQKNEKIQAVKDSIERNTE